MSISATQCETLYADNAALSEQLDHVTDALQVADQERRMLHELNVVLEVCPDRTPMPPVCTGDALDSSLACTYKMYYNGFNAWEDKKRHFSGRFTPTMI